MTGTATASTVPVGVAATPSTYANERSSGPPDIVFNYGSTGDTPVVGDWDGDGVDTVGVVRGNTWYLRNATTYPARGGEHDVRPFRYGLDGDHFLAGDWDAFGGDRPALVHNGGFLVRYTLDSGYLDRGLMFGTERDDTYLTWDTGDPAT